MPQPHHENRPSQPPAVEEFKLPGFTGQVVSAYRPQNLEAEVQRLVDPAAAEETIHWGRNYLYRTHWSTDSSSFPVVVKQFRNQGPKAQLRKRLKGSKAFLSWRMSRHFQTHGLPTAEAVMLAESTKPQGPSFFITRQIADAVEARYLLRAANAEREKEEFPNIDLDHFLVTLGQTLKAMHDAGIFHRDLSIGNVLWSEETPYIIDLNRARLLQNLSVFQRTRDLCRLAIFREEHQNRFLKAYWETGLTPLKDRLYQFYRRGFLSKIETKKAIRAKTKGVFAALRPRRAHAHIPDAPTDASARDKIVWDYLSDQPHQHAGRFEKLAVRLRDAPSHVRQNFSFLAATPRIWKRYRELKGSLYQQPAPFNGIGICVRPLPQAPEALLSALGDLQVKKVLLRLHPWQDHHDEEEALARELVDRGYELAFSLPQNRDLVRDPKRWSGQIEELAERFTPFGKDFQIGQAINRSKWGIWQTSEYVNLAAAAIRILKRYEGVQVLGPSVIDFEYHVTAAVLNLNLGEVSFDAVASLLYVDRRGAPENRQMGFDTVDKVVLLKAIADTARNSAPRSWITEVNWPLWEGPHSPAGRGVSVDEESQADYLARYYLLALATGAVERIYWWQLVARGYGLCTLHEAPLEGLARRPAFHTLATLARQLQDHLFIAPVATEPGSYLYLFHNQHGEEHGKERFVGWCAHGKQSVTLPKPVTRIVERDGAITAIPATCDVNLSPSVRYFCI